MFGDEYGILVREDSFGYYRNQESSHGEVIRRFTLENRNRMTVEVITYGATITSIKVPDANGEIADVVLGFDNITGYHNCSHYFGCIVGRVCNRIANGKFCINDQSYQVSLNQGKHHLHGGFRGYDKVLWDSHVEGHSLLLTYSSPDLEEGYPGEVLNQVTYSLTDKDELIIEYKATSTKSTPISLTNHSYFNLAGHNSGSISNHELMINADNITAVDSDLIPTGNIRSVERTAYDFTKPAKIGDKLMETSGSGFDQNYCINDYGTSGDPIKVACLKDVNSGRIMEVFSTQPGLQLYTANFLPEDDSLVGKENAIYKKNGAICLETQNFPNFVNIESFPNGFITSGDCYHQTTVYKFSTVTDNNDENSSLTNS